MHSYTTKKLYEEFVQNKPLISSTRKLIFSGIGNRDVYNPSIPFYLNGTQFIAGRVEPRHNIESQVLIFEATDTGWQVEPSWKPIPLEDPFHVVLQDVPLLGGVETRLNAEGEAIKFRTVIYDISHLDHPRRVFEGPWGMKDLRFVQHKDGRIGVFTRPQGGPARLGICGYAETSDVSHLTHEDIADAPLLSDPQDGSWEGVNYAIPLDNNRIALLGHIAWMEEGAVRHYYAAVAEFHRREKKKTPWRIIVSRTDLPPGPAKRDDLIDVLFPGGIVWLSSDKIDIYLGVSDAECWVAQIDNPFN